MVTIYKYPLVVDDVQLVETHRDATVLCVQVQHGGPVVWLRVNTERPRCRRTFRVVGTGHPANDIVVMPYVGTFQLQGGALVFHLFDGGER